VKVGELYERTTTPEFSDDRTGVRAWLKTESELCVCTRVSMCVSTLYTHTFEGLQS